MAEGNWVLPTPPTCRRPIPNGPPAWVRLKLGVSREILRAAPEIPLLHRPKPTCLFSQPYHRSNQPGRMRECRRAAARALRAIRRRLVSLITFPYQSPKSQPMALSSLPAPRILCAGHPPRQKGTAGAPCGTREPQYFRRRRHARASLLATPKNPSRHILPACCTRTTSGHAAPPQSMAVKCRHPTNTAMCLFPCEGRRRIRLGGDHGTMSPKGQKAKYSLRANVVRCCPQ